MNNNTTKFRNAARFQFETAMKRALEQEALCRRAICNLPKGGIKEQTQKGHEYYTFRCSNNHQRESLALSNAEATRYIKAIDRRKALLQELKDMHREIRELVKVFLAQKWNVPPDALRILEQEKNYYKRLPFNSNLPLTDEDDWLASLPIVANVSPPDPEKLKFKTASGLYVRSKNEMVLINEVEKRNLEFRYEVPLFIGGRIVWVDLMIRDPLDSTAVAMEFFGMMDQYGYRKSVAEKIVAYEYAGFHYGDRFLAVFCNSDEVFDVEALGRMLDQRFCLK